MSVTLSGLQHSINQQSFKIETIENKIFSIEKEATKIVSLKEGLLNQETHSEHLYKTVDHYETHTKNNTKALNELGRYVQEVDSKVESLSSKVDNLVLPSLEKIVKEQSEIKSEISMINGRLDSMEKTNKEMFQLILQKLNN